MTEVAEGSQSERIDKPQRSSATAVGAMMLVAFAVGFGAAMILLGRSAPTSFEECVLHEQRGQNWELNGIVSKVCDSRFPQR